MIDFSRVEFDSNNPNPRCACVLLLDVSGSMSGNAIQELNAGIQSFKRELQQDEMARMRVEVAIVTFGGSVQVAHDFVTADQFTPPHLVASGDTPMGSAISLALDKLEERKQLYKANGTPYYRPWVFLVTDGEPTDGNAWEGAARRVHEVEKKKKVAFFSVGVAGANVNKLAQIAPRQPLMLQGLNFNSMFQWLSASLVKVSQSNVGDEVPLQSPLGWATV